MRNGSKSTATSRDQGKQSAPRSPTLADILSAPVDFPGKTFWKGKSKDLWEFFCPFCKLKRRLPYRPQPGGFRQISQVVLTTALVTLASWPWFDWKGVVSFVPLWGVFEIIYRSRLRTALVCQNCGFDPYLYLTDVKKARTELEKTVRARYAEKGVPFPVKPGKPGSAKTETKPTDTAELSSPKNEVGR